MSDIYIIKQEISSGLYTEIADVSASNTKYTISNLNMGKTYKISKWQHIYDLDQANVNFSAKGYLGKRDLATITTNLANTGISGAIAEGAGAINKVTPKKITVEIDAKYREPLDVLKQAFTTPDGKPIEKDHEVVE